MNLQDFIKQLKPGEFKVRPRYNVDGDFISVYFSPKDSYEERINEYVTLYYSFETKEITGCKIKGIKPILSESLKEIEDGNEVK